MSGSGWHYAIGRLGPCLLLSILCAATSPSLARDALPVATASLQDSTHAADFFCVSKHDIGRFKLTVTTHGQFGMLPWYGRLLTDYFTGNALFTGSEFPIGSGRIYIVRGGLWVGGVVDDDTLVTTTGDDQLGWEWRSGPQSGQQIEARSSLNPFDVKYLGAVSEQDLIMTYTDTLRRPLPWPTDDYEYRRHKPLGLAVTQESYAWSYNYAGDIVFFNLRLRNIGERQIRNAYIGLTVHLYIGFSPRPSDTYDDFGELGGGPVCGFLREFPSSSPCGLIDTVNVAWGADNNGNPYGGQWIEEPIPVGDSAQASTRGVLGLKLLQPPDQSGILSFNWWLGRLSILPYLQQNDYGPQRTETFRDFHYMNNGLPVRDVNRYHVLRNGEIDFPSCFTREIAYTGAAGWVPPPLYLAPYIADGDDVVFLLSHGPYDIPPGASLSFPFAVFCGENFHVDPGNGQNLPDEPRTWLANVDFSSLAKNAVWAQKIYDNPGVDTDGDGYAGEYRICNLDSALIDSEWVYTVADTQWYKGDGVPDWQAAGPPPAPHFWLTPIPNGIHIRINGQESETTPDLLSRQIDFEGYNVYLGRDARVSSLSLVASYDRENYNKYTLNPASGRWEQLEDPFTLEELRCLYGSDPDPCADSSFHPLNFTSTQNYYRHPDFPDSIFYFAKHGYNQWEWGDMTPLRRRFPNAPDPRGLPADSLTDEYYTEDGYFKFFEYEMEMTDLLALVPWWVNVTVFDFGLPKSGLEPQETSPAIGMQEVNPYHDLDAPISGIGRVYVYPNPYRIDGRYRAEGYEGRGLEDMPEDKVRLLHFANLPPKCTIKIFSLDGDRLITIQHDKDPSDPTAHHDTWNLITRNHQRPVSGLYYWTVEIPGGEAQIGKIALIM